MAELSDPDIKRKILTSPDAETEKFTGIFKIADGRAILCARQLTTTSAPSSTANSASSAARLINKINTCSRPRHVYLGNKSMSTAAAASGAGCGAHSSHATASFRPRRPLLCFRCLSDSHLANRCPIKVPSAGTATRLDIWNMRAYPRRRSKAKLEYTIWTNNWSFQVRPVLIIRLMLPLRCLSTKYMQTTITKHTLSKLKLMDPLLPIRFEIGTGSALITIITKSDFDKLGLPLAALSKPTVKLIGF